MRDFHHYQAYGLVFRTDKALPHLYEISEIPPHINLTIFLMPPPLPEGLVWTEHSRFANRRPTDQKMLTVLENSTATFTRMAYLDHTAFTFNAAFDEVYVEYPPEYSLEYVTAYITNQVLAFYLRIHGYSCLHASGVQLGEGDKASALLFVAPSGFGKSTTAHYFARQGCPVIGDDIGVLSKASADDDRIVVHPAYPHLRVWAETVETVFGDKVNLPKIAPDWGKHFIDVSKDGYHFAQRPLPVSGICLLNPRAEEIEIVDLGFVQALMVLMDNGYLNYILDDQLRAGDFATIAKLVEQAHIFQISAAADIQRLPELYERIIRHLGVSLLPT